MDDAIEVAVWLALRGSDVLAARAHGQALLFLPGGLIEPGESGAEAAAREVREEIGHLLSPESLREIGVINDKAVGRPGTRVELRCFSGGPLPGAITRGEDEIAEIAWIAPPNRSVLSGPVLKALTAFGGPGWTARP